MPRQYHITPLTDSQLPALAGVLSAAFSAEPNFTYLLPQATRRRAALPWFFGFVVRLGRQCGVVYTTPTTDGGAIWLPPQRTMTLRDTLRAGGWALPVCFGWQGLRRSLALDQAVATVRQRVAPPQHWSLLTLGVAPAQHGRGLGSALLQPILVRADAEGAPCYLETFKADVVAFYQKQGFRVMAEDRVRGGGPPFWAMVRDGQGRWS